MSEVLRAKKGAGFEATVAIRRESSTGGFEPTSGQFSGDEALACVLWPGDDRAVSAAPDVEWYRDDANDISPPSVPTVKLSLSVEMLDALEPGHYEGRIMLADLARDIAFFELELEAGPGTRVARVIYHTYKDLRDVAPWVDQIRSSDFDEAGFNDIGGIARDWIDREVEVYANDRFRGCGYIGYPSYSPTYDYAGGLASDGLRLTTPFDRSLVWASVYKTLSILCERCLNRDDVKLPFGELADAYAAKAESHLRSSWAHVGDLPEINLGAMRPGRVTR